MSAGTDGTGTIPATYATEWSGRPIQPVDEATARARHRPKATETYAVALGEPVLVAIEVQDPHEFIGVIFADHLSRHRMQYFFRGADGQLFLTNIAEWEYAGDSDPDLGAPVVREWVFGQDGSLRITTFNKVLKENLMETAKEPVDVSDNWEPVPEFGDWASITRPDRDKPLDQQPDWHQQLFGGAAG
jgi:hypothetical protein